MPHFFYVEQRVYRQTIPQRLRDDAFMENDEKVARRYRMNVEAIIHIGAKPQHPAGGDQTACNETTQGIRNDVVRARDQLIKGEVCARQPLDQQRARGRRSNTI